MLNDMNKVVNGKIVTVTSRKIMEDSERKEKTVLAIVRDLEKDGYTDKALSLTHPVWLYRDVPGFGIEGYLCEDLETDKRARGVGYKTIADLKVDYDKRREAAYAEIDKGNFDIEVPVCKLEWGKIEARFKELRRLGRPLPIKALPARLQYIAHQLEKREEKDGNRA